MKLLLFLPLWLLVAGGTHSVSIHTSEGTLSLEALAEDAIRVRVARPGREASQEELIFTENVRPPKCRVKRTRHTVTLRTRRMSAVYDIRANQLRFLDAKGQVLLKDLGRALFEEGRNPVGLTAVVCFDSPAGEHLYGTGQFQDGYLDIRGLTRRLTQVNTQVSLPMILSSRGWGLLWHNYGLTDFNPAQNSVRLAPYDYSNRDRVTVDATGTAGNWREHRYYQIFENYIDIPADGEYALLLDVGREMARQQLLSVDGKLVLDYTNLWLPPTAAVKVQLSEGRHSVRLDGVLGDSPVVYWRAVEDQTVFSSPVAEQIDYVVFAGGADQVQHSFRSLSGHVPALPDWIFRYIHCRERYDTQDELLAAARRFHEAGTPVGTLVQDWQWWGKYGWNAMRFDEDKYPDPKAMTDELHAMDQHLMLSVWSRIGRDSELGKEAAQKDYYIEGTEWIDFFKPDAAAFYWKNFSEKLLPLGIDAWWQDATEPENDDLKGRRIGPDRIPGEWYRNVYPLLVIRTVYDGLRRDDPDRLPVILTRSAYPGIQRYGAVTWSGDVGNDWGTLRRQIAGGLGQMAAGLPWWTYDAGGFFRPGSQYDDPDYHERMIRWIQASVWLPFMRVHGYQSRTEPWEYCPETRRLFEAAIAQREALQPYILQQARRVWEEDYTLMRPLIFDFPGDEQALRQDCEWMFGPDYLVCPVTEGGVSAWKVYLPENPAGWEDIRDGARYEGGRYVEVPVNLEAIPVFRRL